MKMVLNEGDVLNSIFHNRTIRSNANCMMVTVGPTGSSKSMSNCRIAELWYQKQFKEPFPEENICFGVLELLRRIQSKEFKKRKGELLILEEAGTSMGNLDFQSKTAKAFGYVLQSFRSMNLILLMNLPNFSMLNKTGRTLAHIMLQTIKIDKKEKKSYLKCFQMQTNAKTGETYYHKPQVYIDGCWEKLDFFTYGLPSKELLEIYEKKKARFVSNTIQAGIDILEAVEAKENPVEKPLPPLQRSIRDCWSIGVTKQNDIAEQLGISQAAVSGSIKLMAKKEIFQPEAPYVPKNAPKSLNITTNNYTDAPTIKL